MTSLDVLAIGRISVDVVRTGNVVVIPHGWARSVDGGSRL